MVLAFAFAADPLLFLIGALVVGLLATLAGLAVRGWRRRAKRAAPLPVVSLPREAPAKAVAVDEEALRAAVAEAEAEGAAQRLPGLYLSLAQSRLQAGEVRAAEDLLRKCLRSAASKDLKETHAKARVALGDIAQASGDPVTACEHWQIARNLYHELHRRQDFDAVDARMLRNGCPSDWVLTDF